MSELTKEDQAVLGDRECVGRRDLRLGRAQDWVQVHNAGIGTPEDRMWELAPAIVGHPSDHRAALVHGIRVGGPETRDKVESMPGFRIEVPHIGESPGVLIEIEHVADREAGIGDVPDPGIGKCSHRRSGCDGVHRGRREMASA